MYTIKLQWKQFPYNRLWLFPVDWYTKPSSNINIVPIGIFIVIVVCTQTYDMVFNHREYTQWWMLLVSSVCMSSSNSSKFIYRVMYVYKLGCH